MNITSNFMNILNETIFSSFTEQDIIKNVASDDFIKSLNSHIYKGVKGERCPISFKSFDENTQVTTLPCNHTFETNSIFQWLTKEKSECPVCRSKFPSHEHMDDLSISTAYSLTPLINLFPQHPYGPTNIERLATVICEDDDIIEIETALFLLLKSFL